MAPGSRAQDHPGGQCGHSSGRLACLPALSLCSTALLEAACCVGTTGKMSLEKEAEFQVAHLAAILAGGNEDQAPLVTGLGLRLDALL